MFPRVAPTLEDDETLYSWCAAVHRMSSQPRSQKTSEALFGNSHSMRQHDVPHSIGALACHFGGSTAILALLRGHTAASCYFPFLSPSERAAILRAAAEAKPHWSRALLGVSRSRPIQHLLRWCNQCIVGDVSTVGRSYWHVQHQLPGTLICQRHGEPLLSVPGRHKQWLTPTDCSGASPRHSGGTAEFVAAAVAAEATRHEYVNANSIRSHVLWRLRDIGVIHSLSRASHSRLERWFRASQMGAICRSEESGLTSLADGTWIASELWRQKRSHPARWIALWSALEWRDPSDGVLAWRDACSGAHLDRDGQHLLFGSELSEVRAPTRVYDVLKTANTYAEAMLALGVGRSELVRWLTSDRQLQSNWRARLRAMRVEALLAEAVTPGAVQAAQGYDGIELRQADLRWLAKNAPEAYWSALSKRQRRLF